MIWTESSPIKAGSNSLSVRTAHPKCSGYDPTTVYVKLQLHSVNKLFVVEISY